MHITRLRLQNWRNFVDVDVPLARRNFIIGPNASGKSNLLDAIRFLRDVAQGGLQQALSTRGGISKVRSLSAGGTPGMLLEVDLGDDQVERQWRYTLAVRREPHGSHRSLVTTEQVVDADGKVLVRRPDKSDRSDDLRLTQTFLEQVAANAPFREIPEFLASIHYLHLVPQLIRYGEEIGGKYLQGDPFGQGFLEQIAATSEKRRTERLRRIGEQIHQVLPQFDENITLCRDDAGRPHLEVRVNHWRRRAARQREDQLSDGTLRLIGLLWLLRDAGGPLLLEEPELSLQSDVVRQLAPMFASAQRRRTRQILVTTHSADLLQEPGIAPNEVLIVDPQLGGSVVRSGADDESALELARHGYSVGDMLHAKSISMAGAQLPLRP